MKLTVRETKKAIKNNQTVKFTLERNNARELTSNKKYYKRYVKAIVKTIKSFYPALDSSYILSELERYEILPNISRFDEEGYLIRYGKQRYVTAQTFEVTDNKIYWVDFDYNSKYFVVDEYLGMKLDNDVAVSDPFTNHFAILANDPNVLFHVTDEELLPLFLKLSMKSNGTFNIAVDESIFAGTKSKMMSLDKQNFVRKEYVEEIKNIQNKIVDNYSEWSSSTKETALEVIKRFEEENNFSVLKMFNQFISNSERLDIKNRLDKMWLETERNYKAEHDRLLNQRAEIATTIPNFYNEILPNAINNEDSYRIMCEWSAYGHLAKKVSNKKKSILLFIETLIATCQENIDKCGQLEGVYNENVIKKIQTIAHLKKNLK